MCFGHVYNGGNVILCICSLSENPVTFSLIAAVISAYLIALIVCIRLDRYDDSKGKPVHLIDNSPHDTQKYIVTLETGFRKNAGTTAKVSWACIRLGPVLMIECEIWLSAESNKLCGGEMEIADEMSASLRKPNIIA